MPTDLMTALHLAISSLSCVMHLTIPYPKNTAASRGGGGRFLLSKCKDLSQCTDNYDVAVASRLAGLDFDSINERADGIDNPRARCLVGQSLLKAGDFSSVEVRQIRMDSDFQSPVLRLQFDLDLALTRLQASQLVPYGTGVPVTPDDEVQAAFDATLDLLKLFQQAPARSLTFLAEAGQLTLELGREFVDERLVAEQNISQPIQHALF